jgi:hypothetical protein
VSAVAAAKANWLVGVELLGTLPKENEAGEVPLAVVLVIVPDINAEEWPNGLVVVVELDAPVPNVNAGVTANALVVGVAVSAAVEVVVTANALVVPVVVETTEDELSGTLPKENATGKEGSVVGSLVEKAKVVPDAPVPNVNAGETEKALVVDVAVSAVVEAIVLVSLASVGANPKAAVDEDVVTATDEVAVDSEVGNENALALVDVESAPPARVKVVLLIVEATTPEVVNPLAANACMLVL